MTDEPPSVHGLGEIARRGRQICGAPCHYGGLSATRKYPHSELGWIWHCNRHVGKPGDRCWQHPVTGSA
jgi:hypothetical protein